MNWLIWKQHRKQLLILAVILVLYAALAVPMGLHLWHIYQQAISACKKTDTCGQLSNSLFRTGWDSNLNPSLQGGGMNLVVLLGLALPFLLGMFVGVPLITREYNAGTNLLVWTRSVSRRKWLTAKLMWILIAVALFTGGIAALTTYWAKAGNALYLSRYTSTMFDIQGSTPVGYALFAVSVGIALGAWLKRTMVAIGLTLALMLATQIIVANFVRPHYMTAYTTTVWTNQLGPGVDQTQVPKGVLVTSFEIVNRQGQTLNWSNPPAQCLVPANELPQGDFTGNGHHQAVAAPGADGSIMSVNGGPAIKGSCLLSQGYHYDIKYQPAHRYWDFQRIETGLYLALSLIPLGATYWLVLKRDA